jgi:hypothetical protein
MKNLIVVTSVIRNPVLSPHRTEEERITETLNTFKSIRIKIPNSYIVLLEGGEFNQDDELLFKKHVDEIIYLSVKGLDKSLGVLTLFDFYFKSKSFLEIRKDLVSLSGIAGRYYLNDTFEFNENLNAIKKDDVSWSGRGACSARYWRVNAKEIDNTVAKLDVVKNNFGKYIDVEHAFYEYKVVPLDNIENGKLVGVTGFVSPLGIWEND